MILASLNYHHFCLQWLHQQPAMGNLLQRLLCRLAVAVNIILREWQMVN